MKINSTKHTQKALTILRWSLLEFWENIFLLWSAIFSFPLDKQSISQKQSINECVNLKWCVCMYQWYEEGIFKAKAGCNDKHGIQTAQKGPEQNHLSYVRLYRHTGEMKS